MHCDFDSELLKINIFKVQVYSFGERRGPQLKSTLAEMMTIVGDP